MVWVTLRFDVIGATTSTLILGIVSVSGALAGFTPFPTLPDADRVAVLQLFTIAMGTTGLVLAAVL